MTPSYIKFILILTILTLIGISVFGTTSENGMKRIFVVIIPLLLITVLIDLWKALILLPNEKSVTVDKMGLTINFPFFKNALKISFDNVIYIRVKDAHEKNESILNIRGEKFFLGSNEGYLTINSIDSTQWRNIAIEYNLPLIIHRDIEENVIKEKGIFGTNYLNRDEYYIIQKSFNNDNEKIELNSFLKYVDKNKWISELGSEEFINVPESVQLKPMHQFVLSTKYGSKELNFFEGKLVANYEKNQDPIEIQRISNELKLCFKKMSDLK